jgi:hypothetical protein
MRTLKTTLCCLGLLAVLSSCKKDTETPTKPTPYFVRMTDAPGSYKAVYVDIRSVEITGGGHVLLSNMNAGIYNLLDLTNGNDTLIASFSLNTPRVEQIRLILGPNNSVVTNDNVSHTLSTPSAQQSGLKIQVHQDLQAGTPYSVLLDFDAEKSVVDEGNGSFSLKPVITIKSANTCTNCL